MISLVRLIENNINKCLTIFRLSVYGAVKVKVLCNAFVCTHKGLIVVLRSVKK